MRSFKYELYKGDALVGTATLAVSAYDVVPDTFTIKQKDLLPEIFTKWMSKSPSNEEILYTWLKTRLPDLAPCGPMLDERIVEELGLSRRMLNRGRLDGLLNLIALLRHYEKDGDDYRILPVMPTTISFLHIPEWDRIFVDTKEGARCI